MRIRPLKPSDLPYFNIPSFPLDTRMWIYEKRTPFAYAGYSIAPGLPYLADLYIYVMPAYRRKGYGSTLLKHVFGHIKDVSVTLLSSPVNHIKSPSARFLKGHGFEIEHVELELVCDLAQATFSADPALSPNVGNRAAELMRQLYDDSFGPMPWYQPYEDADEILDDLGTDGEILLWRSDNIPIGFAGIRYVNSHRTGLVADIEPLGIIHAWQGKGVGRRLLSATLAYLQQKGCMEAQLAVWERNTVAIALYKKFGFRPKGKRIFMARKVNNK